MKFPASVQIVEVSPRDGLQNEKELVPVAVKVELIKLLIDAGLTVIEAASFVSPKWVPQLADGREVMAHLPALPYVRYPVLVPNMKGFELAVNAGAREIAVFTTSSEQFSQKNTNCSVAESVTYALIFPVCWVVRMKVKWPPVKLLISRIKCMSWVRMKFPWAIP
jgi:hydroxymethylglutaryl-CoA lyase